jgi:hypothetical protein
MVNILSPNMMKKLLILFCIAHFIVIPNYAQSVKVSMRAGCTTSPNIYRVTLSLYKDCSAAAICLNCPSGPLSPSCYKSISIYADSSNQWVFRGSQAVVINTTVSGFDAVQQGYLAKTICNNCGQRIPGSFTPGLEVYTFEGDINLAGLNNTCKVKLVYSDCCRPQCSTISNATAIETYGELILDKCITPCNNSPYSVADQIALFPSSSEVFYNPMMIDYEGDSLSYSLAPLKKANSIPVPYLTPYSFAAPIPYLGAPSTNLSFPQGLHLNPRNGDIYFKPNGNWNGPIVLEVKEWRKIGSNPPVVIGVTECQIPMYSLPIYNNALLSLKSYDLEGKLLSNASPVSKNINLCPGETYCENLVAKTNRATDSTEFITPIYYNSPGILSFTNLYSAGNKPREDSVRLCFTMPFDTINSTDHKAFISFYNYDFPLRNLHTRAYQFTYRKTAPTIDYRKTKLSNTNYHFAYTLTETIALQGSQTKWLIEKTPGSNTFHTFYADSLQNYMFGSAGNFKVILSLTGACSTYTYNYQIEVESIKISQLSLQQNTCFNKGNGSILVSTINSFGPISYRLNQQPWSNSNYLNNLAAGSYWVYVKDSTQKQDSVFVTITQPPPIKINVGFVQTIKCYNDSNGIIQLTAMGGTAPYKFFKGVTPLVEANASNQFMNLNSTQNRYWVIDSNNCSFDTSFALIAPSPISANIQTTPESCLGRKDATATAMVSGGNAPYEVTWYTNPSKSGSTLSNLGNGPLNYQIKDNNQCIQNGSILIPFRLIQNTPQICKISIDTAASRPLIIWNKAEAVAAKKYYIFKSYSATGSYTLIDSINYQASGSYLDQLNYNPNQVVSYKISLLDSCGTNTLSNYHSASLLNAQNNNQINSLQWQPYKGLSGLQQRVWKSTNGSNFQMVATLGSTANTWIDSMPNLINHYRIEWIGSNTCNTGNSQLQAFPIYSNTAIVSLSSLPENKAKADMFSIYPNPSNGKITIKNATNNEDIKRIELTNLLGSSLLVIVNDKPLAEQSIDLGAFAAGTYNLVITTEKGRQQIQPIVLQK